MKNLVKLLETDEAKGSKVAPKKCLIQPMNCTTQTQLCTIFSHLFFKKGSIRSMRLSVYFKVVASMSLRRLKAGGSVKGIIVSKDATGSMAIIDFHHLLASPSILEFPFTQPLLNWPERFA